MLLINAELLESIDTEFERLISTNPRIRSLYKKVEKGRANFNDSSNLAIQVGHALSSSFKTNISPEMLPDGRMSWNIANEVVRPEIVKGYDYTASYFNKVQNAVYKSKKLNIKGAKPDINESRINGFMEKLSSDDYEKVSWLLEDPGYIVNYMESVVDTGIKNNVGMLGQAGIRSKIVREIDGNACPWCVSLAGEYEYGEEPDDVYRRHRDCHCKVTYSIPEGFRKYVWSKKPWGVDDAENKKQFKAKKTQLTPTEAKRLEQLLLNQ